jgi:ElaB/YqjD/DUF883 family membrane-anchored ribosome-binding protein
MQNENAFSTTQQNLNDLKDTALDASRDLGKTALDHAGRAKSQLTKFASDAKSDAMDQLDQVRGSAAEVMDTALEYVSARPLASLGIVLGVGVLIGLAFRTRKND